MRVENQQNQNIVELMQQTSCTRETKEAGLFGNAGKTSETGVVSGTSVNVRKQRKQFLFHTLFPPFKAGWQAGSSAEH